MGEYFIKLIVFVGTIILARLISLKSVKSLNQEKREQLRDINSKNRLLNWFILLAIIGFFYFSIESNWFSFKAALLIYSIALLSFVTFSTLRLHKALHKQSFPPNYIRQSWLATIVRTSGLIAFLYLLY